jgi:transposase-like protein
MRDENVVRHQGGAMSAPHPDPRCPKCGYTMCELFDYAATRIAIALSATPNGKYQCYRCTALEPQRSRIERIDPNWLYTNEHGDQFKLVETGDRVVPFVVDRVDVVG